MPVYPDVIIVVRALVECLPAAVVAVKAACTVAGKTVRARIAARHLVAPLVMGDVSPGSSREIAIAAAFYMSRGACLLTWRCDDVDGTKQRRCSIDPACWSFEHFNTFDFADVNWEIKHVVSCLRVADVDAVEQDSDLLAVAASDAHVSLRSNRSTLPDIHACGIFQQIVNTLHWRRLYIGSFQYSYHSRSLGACQRCLRTANGHLVERHLAVGLGGNGVCCHLSYADASGTGVLQRGNAEHTHQYLTSKTSKQRVAFASKMLEHDSALLLV